MPDGALGHAAKKFYDRNYDMFMLEQWSDEEAGEEEGRQGVEGGVMNRYPKRDQDKI